MRLAAAVVAVAMTGAALAAPAPGLASGRDAVVYRTMTPSQENTFFDITTLYHPEVGQSLTVRKAATWRSLEMGTSQLKLVKEPEVLQWLVDGKYDENWFVSHFRNFRVTARVVIQVWRLEGPGGIPEAIDLADGYTLLSRTTQRASIPIGDRVTFPLKRGIPVTPGHYFITIGLRFDDPRVFNLRFTGQENGTNTLGGFDHDHPVRPECANYKMTKDSHPGGQAYGPLSDLRPTFPNWVAPFALTFGVVDTKVLMPCDMKGVYDPNLQIWNPGDLSMTFRGVWN